MGPTSWILAEACSGRHVTWRAHHLTGARQVRVSLDDLGQPEVGDVRLAAFIKQDVARFQIAVNDALLVGVGNRICDLFAEACGGGCARGPSRMTVARLVPSM